MAARADEKKSSVGRQAKGKAGHAVANGTGRASELIDLDFVRGLIEAVDGSGIDTLEINRGGTKIRLSKTPTTVVSGNPVAAAPIAAAPAPAAGPAPAAAGDNPGTAAAAEEKKKSNLVDVTSPMVGTFYRAPAPEAPPYVEAGSTIAKGQTLCILEAMKLMNELESEMDGVVREVLVDNAEPVEYGQVLFRIEPAGSQG